VTAPTGPAAGVHLPWAQVPESVRAWAQHIGAGTEPTRVRDLAGGFSPGATAVLEWPDRSVFVKAVGSELNPESPSMHRREAVISAALPRTARFPRLLDTFDEGAWVALAFEAVDGRPPRHPWDHGELRAVAGALSAMHDELTPGPVPEAGSLSDFAARLFGGWSALAARGAPPALDRWAATHLDRLAELESGWPDACAGATLVHGDVRADNVLLSGDRVVFVDWPRGSIGNPAYDVVGWAPSVLLEGGPPPEDLLRLTGKAKQADADAVTVLLAAVSGYFVTHSFQPSPPGLPTLRAFQAAQGAVALEWLRERTGW
jgi:Phosphotransferase enzyme family